MKAKKTQPLPEFINEALYGHKGYYSSGQVKFGPDFVTYAEKFAPLLAERFFLMWKSMVLQGEISIVDVFHIYEFGAGTGKMAQRLLEYVHGKSRIEHESEWPAFFKAIKYIIGEISPELLKLQKAALRKYSRQKKVELHQTDARLCDDKFPRGKGVVVTNELFDTFPPHEITVNQAGDIYATVVESSSGAINLSLAPYRSVLSEKEVSFVDAIIEKSKVITSYPRRFYIQPSIENFYVKISDILTAGYVVTIDYGDHAVGYNKQNRPLRTYSSQHGNDVSFLQHKGEIDITVDVNFSDVAFAGEKHGFEIASYVLQDAVGGPFLPEFKILFQRRNIKIECDAMAFSGMELSSPIRYEDMHELSKALARGESHIEKTFSAIAKLKVRIQQNQIARNEKELMLTERLIGQIDLALTGFLSWLDTQNYIGCNKAFMTELHEKFFAIIFELLLLLQNKELLHKTTIIALLTISDLHKAELFLSPVMNQRNRMINEKDPQELAIFFAMAKTTQHWIGQMTRTHPILVTQLYKKRMMLEYNFDSTVTAAEKKQSLLSRCLAAAESDNFIAIKEIPRRNFLLRGIAEEIKLAVHIPAPPTLK
jgi:SAM-dependent MidA family methyltransferase